MVFKLWAGQSGQVYTIHDRNEWRVMFFFSFPSFQSIGYDLHWSGPKDGRSVYLLVKGLMIVAIVDTALFSQVQTKQPANPHVSHPNHPTNGQATTHR